MEPGCDRCNGATSLSFPSWTFRPPGYPFHFLWRRHPWPIGGSRCFSINKFFSTCALVSRIETLPRQVSSGDVKPERSAKKPLPRVGLIRPVLCPARRSLPGRLPNGRNRRAAAPRWLPIERRSRPGWAKGSTAQPSSQPRLHRQLLCGTAVCAVPAQRSGQSHGYP